MSNRSYNEAIGKLNTLQSNAATLEAVRASGGRLSEFAIPEMVEYLERIGYRTEDLNKLNVIHVTGTKGKGSTCAFTNSLLRAVKPEWTVGLYTSPHLVAVRERIRVNGAPISEELFAKFFFEVWDRLEDSTTRRHDSTPLMPMYFRFVTLLAYHAFLSLKVDATILEVGVGGRYDSTNIVPKPVVTGISALGIDHVSVLGKTLPEIAWQKAGIYKTGVPALTVEQPSEALPVLRKEAEEVKASEFRILATLPSLTSIPLGLQGIHQLQNASLAVHLVQSFVKAQTGVEASTEDLPSAYVDGLKNAKWPGRCQTVVDPQHSSTRWHLDGAHTVESLQCCMQWFVSPGVSLPQDVEDKLSASRVIIFNCTNGRSGSAFLSTMILKAAERLKALGRSERAEVLFTHVIFCTNVTYADGGYKGDLTSHNVSEMDVAALKTQQELAAAWRHLVPSFPEENVHVLPSVEHAVRVVRTLGHESTDVLVAGSLHLVGGMIEVAGLTEVAL